MKKPTALRDLLTSFKILWSLPNKMTGRIWDTAAKELFEYNKTIITLSSSALVLSFTVIRFGDISLSKILIGSSWGFFLLVIILGILIQFSTFLHRLTDEVIKINSKEGEYKNSKRWLFEPEGAFYFTSRKIMFWSTAIQLISFWVAFVLLMLAAFLSI